MRGLSGAAIALAIVSGTAGCLDGPRPDTLHPSVDELIERAERGDAQALFELGNRHVDGDGVARDNVLAYMWFSLAAERLATEEGYEARRMQQRLDPDMFRHQIAEAERLARIWKARQERRERGDGPP
jgi:TPR repeat protein